MALARWEPFRELARVQDEFNKLFDDRLSHWRGAGNTEEMGTIGFFPSVDVYEDAEAVRMTAELPGMDPKSVDVRVENGVLTLRGERKLEKEEKKENYRRIEREYGTFTRAFTLPTGVDADKIQASYKDGLLKLTLPKKEESKPKAIKVDVK